ncbi:MAG: hypothetical protein CAPSK01_003941 [Candidatus Accumulibacter vicinus]|uniref:Uncharacterized protein n=1 Tax=Candidatus Accumulibacter vicinus TaxID=2954382 RepID=A0A084XX06_9PROT|nr:MAG: hypothetical protein CAPSK01_003941 [Candidatus Accumulibacter vicinus]
MRSCTPLTRETSGYVSSVSTILRTPMSGIYAFIGTASVCVLKICARITRTDDEVLHLWRARDALALKALSLVLSPRLRLSPRCRHVKVHCGLKAAVREVQQHLPDYDYALRTDVKGF